MARATAERRVLAILLGVIVGLLSISGFAQQISGELTGTIIDEKGAVVNGATVEALNPSTGLKLSTVSRGNGEYRLTNLPIGLYTVTATAPNFSPTAVSNVAVELNKINNQNITLKVGGVATTVEVSGVAPQIDTTTAQLTTNYGEIFAGDLGMAGVGGGGGGVLNLSLLAPNVTNASSMGLGAGPSVGGQRPRNNNFMIEGVDNNNKTVTGNLVNIPNDAVGGFTLLENQFNSDFGHSSGGQFNTVVRSGTNNFHGSVYEYFRNRDLAAIDAVYARQAEAGTAPTNPRFDNNRYGGTFGGPIKKDKLFFFTNFEKEPVGFVGTAGAAVQSPTAAGIAALNATPGLSAINLGVFEKYVPVAPAQASSCSASGHGTGTSPCFITVGGSNIPVGTVSIVNPAFTNYENFVQSVDWNVSSKDQIRGRYVYNQVVGLDTAAQLGTFFQNVPQSFHLVNLAEYHTFGPSVTNEVRGGFNRFAQVFPVGDQVFPGQGGVFPNITLNDLGGGLNIGPDPNAPQFTIQNFYQVLDNLSWVKGSHNLKFGVEARKYISPQHFTQRERGDYIYNSTANFLLDNSPDNFGQRSTGSTTYYGDQSALYFYANDTWRVNTHLSVNLGIRYEYTTIPAGEQRQELNNLASQPNIIVAGAGGGPFVFTRISSQKNLFAPRVGFAYSPGSSGNTSIRAGFGMAYDVLYDNIGTLAVPPQIGSTLNCGAGNTPQCPSTTNLTPNFFANGALPGGGSGISVLTVNDAINNTANWIPPQQHVPYSIQWNLGIQHAFGKNYTADIRYLGTRGLHLSFQDIITQQTFITASHSLPTFLQNPGQAALDALPLTLSGLTAEANANNCLPQYIVSPQAAFCFVTAFMPAGWSRYNGVSGQLTRRLSHGLMFLASYTYSRTIDNSTADFHSTDLTPRRPQDFQNPGNDKSVSALSRTHRFTVAGFYDLPYFKNGNWFERNLLGNWQFSPVYTYESPEWFTVQSTTDSNLNGDSAGDRAILNPKGIPGTGSDVTALTNTAGQTVAYLAVNPNAQFIRAAHGAFANIGRNTLAGRPTDNIDLAITKALSAGERYRFELGAQVGNLFNHPQYLPTNPNNAGQGFGVNDVVGIASGSTGGTIQSLLTPGKANFNRPDLVFPSNSRAMGLSVKFIF
jgi:hypothetical protein